MKDFAKNAVVAGFGITLLAVALLVIGGGVRQIYCWKTGCDFWGLNAPVVISDPAGFADDAPGFVEQVEDVGGLVNHPLWIDMLPRVREIFEQQPRIITYIQYRGYMFWEFQAVTGEFHVFVYRWDGGAWMFVESFCETCISQ